MTRTHTYQALVKDGYISTSIRSVIARCIAEYNGKVVTITIQEKEKLRSIKQNKFYWKMIIPAIRQYLFDNGINFDAEQAHEFVVRHVWKWTDAIEMPDGTMYETRLSSTKLPTKEWENRIEITRQYFAEKGLILPHPNEGKDNYILAG
jgi:hypothetical protein